MAGSPIFSRYAQELFIEKLGIGPGNEASKNLQTNQSGFTHKFNIEISVDYSLSLDTDLLDIVLYIPLNSGCHKKCQK